MDHRAVNRSAMIYGVRAGRRRSDCMIWPAASRSSLAARTMPGSSWPSPRGSGPSWLISRGLEPRGLEPGALAPGGLAPVDPGPTKPEPEFGPAEAGMGEFGPAWPGLTGLGPP